MQQVTRCTCCGLRLLANDPSKVHLDCWIEHHSDPSGPTPGHVCNITHRQENKP